MSYVTVITMVTNVVKVIVIATTNVTVTVVSISTQLTTITVLTPWLRARTRERRSYVISQEILSCQSLAQTFAICLMLSSRARGTRYYKQHTHTITLSLSVLGHAYAYFLAVS